MTEIWVEGIDLNHGPLGGKCHYQSCTDNDDDRAHHELPKDPGQVRELPQKIRSEHGPIAILVNDIWGGELLKGGPSQWNKPIWEHNLDEALRILRLAIDTHLISAHFLLPLLVERPSGLLIEGRTARRIYNASHYRLSVFYPQHTRWAIARMPDPLRRFWPRGKSEGRSDQKSSLNPRPARVKAAFR